MQLATSTAPASKELSPEFVAATMYAQAPSFRIAFDYIQSNLTMVARQIREKSDEDAFRHMEMVYGPKIVMAMLSAPESSIDEINDGNVIQDRGRARKEARTNILMSMVIIAQNVA